MIDRELLRQNPQIFKDSLTNRGGKPELVEQCLDIDTSWRALMANVESLRATKNQLSRGGKPDAASLKKAQNVSKKLTTEETALKKAGEKLDDAISRLPNVIATDVPVGEGESANAVMEKIGRIRLKKGQSHEELMTKLNWLDLSMAAKVSGARFRYLKGSAATAWMELSRLGFQFAVKNGFQPIIPPVLVRADVLTNGGFFPEGEEDTFKVGGDLYLVGTSEYSLVASEMNRTFEYNELPLRLVGFSTCFRKEAGSYGKDVKGMFRQHQFDKVEMVSICRPDQSESEHAFLLEMQKRFVRQLDLPYQVVLIGSGDLEKKAVKRFDLETWFPSQQRYRETHSVSNCTDYQSRSLGIKFRDQTGTTQFAHTLNGTVVTERLLLAYIENNQRPDGSVNLPRHWRI
ncbi:MAG: serine--tRNA ligase [bacterium]|nr:serine--tRNA ligase [bacterium]